MNTKEPACRSVDYSRLGIVVSKGISKAKRGSTTFIKARTGWVYKHKPSKEYSERLEELRFKNPGISNDNFYRKPRPERIYELREKSENNCAKLLSKIVLFYNIPWEEK